MRFKSVLGAFLFIVLASIVALFVFIQTQSFGALVTRVVSDIAHKRTNSDISIRNLSISFFPAGIELNKVNFKKQIAADESIEAEFGKIGIYVSLFEIEERRLTLGEIKVSDSVINYQSPEKDGETKEIPQQVIDQVFELSDDSPVGINTLIVENTKLILNHELLEAKRLKLFKKSNSFIARFHLANIKPLKDRPYQLDEVWGDLEVFRKDLKIYRIKLQHDVHNLVLKGKVKNYRKLKSSEVALNGEGSVHLQSMLDEILNVDFIKVENGFAKFAFSLKIKDQQLSGNSNLSLEEFRSNLFHADELNTRLHFDHNQLSASLLEFVNGEAKINLLSPVLLADFSQKKFLTKPIHAEVQNVSLNNALRFLGPNLRPLKGYLNGKLAVEFKGSDVYIRPQDNFLLRKVGLVVGDENPNQIIMIEWAKLKNSEFNIVNNEFQMSADIETQRSKFSVDGFINKSDIRFQVPESYINVQDLGDVANLGIKGEGPLTIDVGSKLANTIINIKGKTKNFEILGYRLGEVDKNVSIDLKESSVIIHKMDALYGQTHITGTGLVNYKTADIALGINSNDASFNNLEQILHPIMSKIDFLPSDLNLRARIDVDIFGKYRLPELKIRSKVDFEDLVAYGEGFRNGSFNIALFNETLSFRNLKTGKGNGDIKGDFSYGLTDQKLNLDYLWSGIDLTTINAYKRLGLNLNGKLSGSLTGTGTTKNYQLKLLSKVSQTNSQNYRFDDSNVLLEILPGNLKGQVNLLGDLARSKFNYYINGNERSDANLKVNAEEIKPYLVAIFGQHLETESLSGKVIFSFDTSFGKDFKNLDLNSSLSRLEFYHPEFNVSYQSKNPEFVVKLDQIKKWDLKINQNDLTLLTSGNGKFGQKVLLSHEAQINSKLVEILFSKVLSAEGLLHTNMLVAGAGDDYDLSISSKAKEVNMTVEGLPVGINKLRYEVDYSGKRLVIKDITAALDPGYVTLKGDVYFDSSEPDVNLKYILERAEIPILRKSSINLTGEGILLGNQFPYNLGGDILINKALIVNELNEFSSKSAALSQIRYLPKDQESVFSKIVNLNVSVKAVNPIRVTNSLMDVALKGEVRVFGNPSRPRGEGHLFAPNNSSRIFFKNSEYLILNADINFSPKKEISNPDFDVKALTLISNYKVYPKAYGDLERFNFDLTSDPALSRNSILSLIAFGYSDEMQGSIRPEDQQNLNQVGVGSFVFDRFKISDILNKQFGLQVNLGTVFEQSSSDSLLAGRSQDSSGQGGGALGRTRSATKIELKKRLDEALTLSVSSTLGGGIGQRQRMNLNYGLTKKVQLEGVYELRTNAEGEEDVIDNSIGADVKFRWTFK